jgi:hypothetical protein
LARADLDERAKIYAGIVKLTVNKEKSADARKVEWIQQPEPLIRAVITDCKHDNEKLTREAMTVLGRVMMSMRKCIRHVGVRLLDAVIEMLRINIERHTQKNGVYLSAWALSGAQAYVYS